MERFTSICPNVSQREIAGKLRASGREREREGEREETENELFHLRVGVEKARVDSMDDVYS